MLERAIQDDEMLQIGEVHNSVAKMLELFVTIYYKKILISAK